MLNVKAWALQIKLHLAAHPKRLFPYAISVIVVVLSLAGISGTSIGAIYPALYGQQKNPDLIIGKPRAIRSDEFLVNTQLTIAQSNSGFPRVNKAVNGGRDMSIVIDVPYWDWSMILKPQNLPFFIMPLENAFALKWWLLIALLAISVYYLSLRITRGKILISILISLIFATSPFIWWWYQTGTNATLYLGVFILLLLMNIIDQRPIQLYKLKITGKWLQPTYTILLTYLLACFAVILYPPFQIPVALVVAFASLGYLLDRRKVVKTGKVLRTVAFSVMASVCVVGAFIATRQEPVKAVSSTVYPGQRLTGSGHYGAIRLLSSNLQFQLQRESKANHYYGNQSESSSFIVLPLIMMVPAAYLIAFTWRKKRKFDWFLASLLAASILFTIHLLVESFSPFNRLFMLQYSPPVRAIIGYGLIGTLMLMGIVRSLSNIKLSKKQIILASAYIACAASLGIWAGFMTSRQFPLFISSPILIIGSAIILYSGYLLVLVNKTIAGLSILAILGVASMLSAQPLYRGLSPMSDTRVSEAIREVDPDKNDGEMWGYGGIIYFENLPQITQRDAVTGVIFYPVTDFWADYATQPDQAAIYNRYAHIQVSDSADELKLIQPDLFTVSNRCSMDIMQELDYLLSTEKITNTCTILEKTIKYPTATFYIYRVSR